MAMSTCKVLRHLLHISQKLIIRAGERLRYVGNVPNIETLRNDPTVRVIQGNGRTLMSGLGDAHTHFTWNETALGKNTPRNVMAEVYAY